MTPIYGSWHRAHWKSRISGMERTLLKPPKGKNTTDLQHALPSLFFIGDSLNFRNKSNGLPHRCAQGESIIKKNSLSKQAQHDSTIPIPFLPQRSASKHLHECFEWVVKQIDHARESSGRGVKLSNRPKDQPTSTMFTNICVNPSIAQNSSHQKWCFGSMHCMHQNRPI